MLTGHLVTLQIASDAVGFGFVIRGEGPVFVKTVDPTGPAAAAGLKVGSNSDKVQHGYYYSFILPPLPKKKH